MMGLLGWPKQTSFCRLRRRKFGPKSSKLMWTSMPQNLVLWKPFFSKLLWLRIHGVCGACCVHPQSPPWYHGWVDASLWNFGYNSNYSICIYVNVFYLACASERCKLLRACRPKKALSWLLCEPLLHCNLYQLLRACRPKKALPWLSFCLSYFASCVNSAGVSSKESATLTSACVTPALKSVPASEGVSSCKESATLTSTACATPTLKSVPASAGVSSKESATLTSACATLRACRPKKALLWILHVPLLLWNLWKFLRACRPKKALSWLLRLAVLQICASICGRVTQRKR